ncbi:MAG: pilin [Patescibacteria group bacterium]
MKKTIFFSSFLFLALILLPHLVLAQASPILPDCASTGRCSLCDIIQTAINFGYFLFGIVGALVLLYFFYGGFRMLISAGRSDEIKKGKDILVNSVVGLMIVFLAYFGVNFIISAVTGGWNWAGNLKCAPLPEPTGWTAPPAGQGSGGGQTQGGTTPAETPAVPPVAPSVPCTNKAGTGTTCKTIAECTNDCFCTGAECVKKRPIGGYPCTKNEQCLNGYCNYDPNVMFCVAPAGSQPEGQFCTDLNECQTGLVCITDTTDAVAAQKTYFGNCQTKLDPGAKCAARALPHAIGNAYEICKGTCNSNGVCQ